MRGLTALAITTLFLTACGGTEPARPDTVTYVVSAGDVTEQALACAERANIGLLAEAYLHIGGHDRCALDLDPDTLEVTGQCDSITIGLVRPHMVAISMTSSNGEEEAALAYVVSYFDGRAENIADGVTDYTVNFAGDSVTLIDPEDAVAPSEPETDIEQAVSWAVEMLDTGLPSLDRDSDGCSNLEEACNGQLFSNSVCP